MLGVGSLKFLAATSATKEHELSCWVLRYLLSGEQQLTSTTGFPISTVSSTFPLICQILLVSLKMWLRLRHAPISILQVAGGRKHVGSKWCCFSVCFLPPSPSHLFFFCFCFVILPEENWILHLTALRSALCSIFLARAKTAFLVMVVAV